jgi:hypothetical protein
MRTCGGDCFRLAAAVCAVLLTAAPLSAANPATSKLGPHVLSSFSPGAGQIISGHPRVIKILGITDAMMSAVRTYKSGTPAGLVVYREWVNTGVKPAYNISQDPATCADDFWTTVLAPPLNLLSPADKALIDYVEGPNECENTPCWESVASAQWYGDFWVRLAQRIADNGYRPLAFSIPVGNPYDLSILHQQLDALVPALRACKTRGGGWSYHGYTGPYTTDPGVEYWYSLRYRQYYEYFATAYPDLMDLPLILTEGGVDTGGNPTGSGWSAHGDAAKYESWLAWYDQQIMQDPYVIGVTLFQVGDTWWSSFNLEPIAGWMANYLGSATYSPVIRRSPTVMSAVTMQGSNAPAQIVTIANAGGGTLNYTLSGAPTWLTLSATSGSSTFATNSITATFSSASLMPNVYTATITVSAAAAINTPQTIPVTLTVQTAPVPADFDSDHDVDAQDLSAFLSCMTGPGYDTLPTCTGKDLNGDNRVDLSDFGILQRCFSGSAIPASPTCGG